MKAQFIPSRNSWKLENGFIAETTYSSIYGEFIIRFHNAGKVVWQACNMEADKLPFFAADWVEAISNQYGPIDRLVRCRFTREFKSQTP